MIGAEDQDAFTVERKVDLGWGTLGQPDSGKAWLEWGSMPRGEVSIMCYMLDRMHCRDCVSAEKSGRMGPRFWGLANCSLLRARATASPGVGKATSHGCYCTDDEHG